MARKYKTYTPEELTVWIRKLIASNDLHAFYICKAWLHLRAEVLKEQHYECQLCKSKGLVKTRTEGKKENEGKDAELVVHHIKSVRRFPWLALTKSNLMVVCDDCHYEIHHGHKPKWNDERW